MSRLVQAIGLALVLALNLVPDRAVAAERGELHGDRDFTRLDASSWLEILEDRSIGVERRLELAVSDPRFVSWFGHLVGEIPPMSATQALEEIPAPQDETDHHILAGLRSLEQATRLLPAYEIAVNAQSDDLHLEPQMFVDALAQLTSPAIPEIIGDEAQSFAEGFVALLGTALLEHQDPDLARELAQIFAERSSRVARLIVLFAVWQGSELELSADASKYVSHADRQQLASDRARAERHVAHLQKLAGWAAPPRS